MNPLRTLAFFFLAMVITACSSSDAEQNKTFENTVDFMVKELQNKEIEIHSIADFKWDKAYLFPPYTSQESIEKKLKVEYEDSNNISNRDDIYLLVFLHEGRVVQYTEINRQKADFTTDGKEYLTPYEDVLKIERHEK
ncbi:hypothetical protein [Rossellomorea sp. KS-H15a]|uniref:hypothetical protein n=1 Tax=Rossellomorea sp. KS-H15a TaxID=2963940 RepID=UPI0020C6B5F9|nr:hypothetical protein [Rossellomorea sp. KS-H15a]UTE76628.1 hypothetical protein M1J35_19040 [Rossellomorea sp. KS-H15a]